MHVCMCVPAFVTNKENKITKAALLQKRMFKPHLKIGRRRTNY